MDFSTTETALQRGNEELVARARQGDAAAFEELVRLHQHELYKFALAMTGGDEASASDILQESLVKAFLAMKGFRGDSSFRSWVWRIVRNEFIDRTRGAGKRRVVDIDQIPVRQEPVADSSPETDTVAAERVDNLRRLVGTLPPKFREIVTLIDILEMSYEEAAELLGISLGTVKSRAFRAREELAGLVWDNRELFR